MTPDGFSTDAVPVTPRFFVVFLGALIALGPLTMDAYLPAMPTMARAFDVSIVTINYTISIYLIGFGIGQFFGGAFSDQVGRKTVGLLGLTLYVLASLGIASANSIGVVLFLRVLQALGGGAATVICFAAIRDVYSPEEAGRKFAAVMLIMLIAPLIAPVIGAYLLSFSWRAVFAGLVGYGVLLMVWYSLSIPETRAGQRTPVSIKSSFVQCFEVVNRRIGDRRVPVRYAISMATAVSVLMIFLTNASFLYIEHFDYSPSVFPLFFGATALSLMAANLTSMKLLGKKDARKLFRLGCAIQWSSITLLLGAALLGRASITVVVPLLMLGVGSVGLISPSGNAVYMGYFKRLAGSAASVFTTSLFFVGSGLGALTGVFFDGSLVPMAAMMFLATTVSNVLAESVYREPMPARA